MAGCANWHSGQVESLMFVGSTPTPVTWTEDWRLGTGDWGHGTSELRSGLENRFQRGLISRPTPVRIRPPQLNGLLVQREDAGLARWKSGFESPAVHSGCSW